MKMKNIWNHQPVIVGVHRPRFPVKTAIVATRLELLQHPLSILRLFSGVGLLDWSNSRIFMNMNTSRFHHYFISFHFISYHFISFILSCIPFTQSNSCIQLQYAYNSLWQSSNIPIPIWKFSITQLYTLENERILNPKMEASDDVPFQLPSKKLTLDIQTPAEKVFGPPQCA